MLCPNCGKELPENTALCFECGYQFTDIQNTAGISSAVEGKPAKKSHKKAVIITSVAVAGAVAVGVPVFLAVRNGTEKQYLKNNPTKYLVGSVTKYFDVNEKDNGVYNFAKSIYKTGGLKFNYNADGTEISAYAGYDSDKKQAYIDASGKMKIMGLEQSASVKSYIDVNSFNVDYDAMGSKGSYFIDFTNLKKDFEGSVFADKNSSLYNEQLEQIINNVEKSYDIVKDDRQMKKDFEETVSQVFKSFETNGHVEVKSEKVNIGQKDYSADVVTYDFKYGDLNKLLDECKNYFIEYVTKYNVNFQYDNVSTEDIEKQINSSIDSAKDSIPQDVEIKIEFYISPDSQQMLKAVYTQTEAGNMGNVSLELPPESETVFCFKSSSSGDKYRDTEYVLELTKQSTDDTVIYRLTNSTSPNSKNRSLTCEYDKKASKMKITNYAGEDSENMGNIPLSRILFNSYAIEQNYTAEFNFECTSDKVSIGEAGWNLELSAVPDIVPFGAEKNIFQLTEQEIQTAFPNMMNNSIINNANQSMKKSNASALDGACKTLYAGTVTGLLNSETSAEELGYLDADKLPSPDSTTAEKRGTANQLTIQDAIDYAGLTEQFADELPYDYVYNISDGTINFFDEGETIEEYNLLLGFESVTLGELYSRQ